MIMVFAAMMVQITALLIFGVAFFGLNMPTTLDKWLRFTWLILLGSICSAILGIAFSAVPKNGRGASAVVSPIVIILQFFSGVFFVFSDLPSWMQQFAALFPLKWLTQGMRSVFLPEGFATQEVAGTWEVSRIAIVLIVWAVAGTLLALRSFKWSD
jgi:ABC-2 type transport system permease protein